MHRSLLHLPPVPRQRPVAELGLSRVSDFFIASRSCHVGAFGCEKPGGGQADAAITAGDERCLIFESHDDSRDRVSERISD